METLKGKNALITGGNRGIGKAIALALAAEGVNIGVIGRDIRTLRQVEQQLSALGVKTSVDIADVSDRGAISRAARDVTSELGPIDILVNSAGIGAFGTLLEMDPDDWEAILYVNLIGTYNAIHAILPSMVKRQTGDIITISSTAGQRGNAGTSAYSASKFGLLGLTESLAMEVRKDNIRVSALLPSTVATDMAINDLMITDGNPEKVLQPEDIAELVVAQLKINRRAFVKTIGIWSTNP